MFEVMISMSLILAHYHRWRIPRVVQCVGVSKISRQKYDTSPKHAHIWYGEARFSRQKCRLLKLASAGVSAC